MAASVRSNRHHLALNPEMLLLDEPMAGMGHEDIDRISALGQEKWRPIAPC